ncbi:MAG: MBL fold metallo-hydrolase [Bradymonadia bacterium]
MFFRQLFDRETCTYTYLLADEEAKAAVLIDPVAEHVDRDAQLLEELGFTLVYTLDTHVHADHITGAGMLRERLNSKSVLSALGGAPCVDRAVTSGDVVQFGRYGLEVRATPGHTDGCVTYVTRELVNGRRFAFTGDTLLIRGCGRTDFQQGSAESLYTSVHTQIFTLPDETAIYPGHDYKGRTCSTVGEEKRFNPRLGGGRALDDFKAIMDNLNLPHPKKLAESLPANQNCGLRPAPVSQAAGE